MAALVALAQFRDPQSLRARLSLVYAEKTPPALVARGSARPRSAGVSSAQRSRLVHGECRTRDPGVRAFELERQESAAGRPSAIGDRPHRRPGRVGAASGDPGSGPASSCGRPFRDCWSSPPSPDSPDYATAVEALCGLRDPRAASVYLAALEDTNPRLRKLAESALLAIRDKVRAELVSAARSGRLSSNASLVLDRVLARFTPIASWLVIGPFPRADSPTFHRRALDRLRARAARAQAAARSPGPSTWRAASGRVDLDDLRYARKRIAAGDSRSDLGAFGYAEVNVEAAGPALLMVGSSGALMVTVNETAGLSVQAPRRAAPTRRIPRSSAATWSKDETGSSCSAAKAPESGPTASRSQCSPRARPTKGSRRDKPEGLIHSEIAAILKA